MGVVSWSGAQRLYKEGVYQRLGGACQTKRDAFTIASRGKARARLHAVQPSAGPWGGRQRRIPLKSRSTGARHEEEVRRRPKLLVHG